MVCHLQKRWRLRFRRDPDSGRVLFIGPLVISLDVVRRYRAISICWTCCDACHREHASKIMARLHYVWLLVNGRA